jgi:hypothetical protein
VCSSDLSDAESQMRFVEAQPPTALRILARSAEELRQECGKLFDCAGERFSREKRTE